LTAKIPILLTASYSDYQVQWEGWGLWHGQGYTRYAYRVLVGETEGKRPLGGNQLRWKDNIKGGLK
jgi:hypothetical protein